VRRALMTRPTTEGCMSIDVRSWNREGLLRGGKCFLHPLTWTCEPTGGIGVLPKFHWNLKQRRGQRRKLQL
jgi:hypothetical protein